MIMDSPNAIDSDGFRPNVGMIIANHNGQLLWARRVGSQDAWQFPQGGINPSEKPEQALYRELNEEVGLNDSDVRVVSVTKGWLRYRLPKRFIRRQKPRCVGQKQKWYLLELLSDQSVIDLMASEKPEFEAWQWVSYWYPLSQVVDFKRDVYRRALRELSVPHGQHFAEAIAKQEAAYFEGASC